MMGPTHAVSGPVLSLSVIAPLNTLLATSGYPLVTGLGVIPLLAASLGAGILPDIDHPSATPARTLGPVTKLVSQTINLLTGGHRGATHSLLGLAGFTWVPWRLGQQGGWGYGVWLGFLAAIAVSALKWTPIKNPVLNTALCLGAGVGLTVFTRYIPFDPWPVTVGTALGVAAHLVGDMLTKDGCPLLWPLPMRFHIASLTTGKDGELLFRNLLWGGLAGLVVYQSSLAAVTGHALGWPAWAVALAVGAAAMVASRLLTHKSAAT